MTYLREHKTYRLEQFLMVDFVVILAERHDRLSVAGPRTGIDARGCAAVVASPASRRAGAASSARLRSLAILRRSAALLRRRKGGAAQRGNDQV